MVVSTAGAIVVSASAAGAMVVAAADGAMGIADETRCGNTAVTGNLYVSHSEYQLGGRKRKNKFTDL